MCPETNHDDPNPGWTNEEIRKMLSAATSSMMRAAILILASSGVRKGGLELKWGDIDPVYLKDGKPVAGEDAPEMSETAEPACAMMHVYRGSSEEYVTFMTPEAYKALMEYKAGWEEEVGKMSEPEDPVFKKDGDEPILLKPNTIISRLHTIVKKSGVRKPSDKKGKSYEVPTSNGFRRRFNKVMRDTPTDGSIRAVRRNEYMLGHHGAVGLDRVYYYAHPMELAADYLHAVQAMTLTREGLLFIEHEKMREEVRKVRAEFAALQHRQEARADVWRRQDADRDTISIKEKMKNLRKAVDDIIKHLDSQDKGR